MTARAAPRRRRSAGRSATRARRGCTATGCAATASTATTSRSRLPPEALRRRICARCRRSASAASTSPSRTRRRRWRSPPTPADRAARDRRRQHPDLRRRTAAIHADNTDGYGFIANLRQQAPDWRAAAGPALVLGAGGSARGDHRGAPRRGRAGGAHRQPHPRPRRGAARRISARASRCVDWAEAAGGRRRRRDHRQHHLARHGRRARPAAPPRRRRAGDARHRPRLRRRADALRRRGAPARPRRPSTASACCCTRPCPASSAGSASAPRSTTRCAPRCSRHEPARTGSA